MISPDEAVAKKIIEKIREAKLLSNKGLTLLLPSLISGTLKPEDWGLLFEADRPDAKEEHAEKGD